MIAGYTTAQLVDAAGGLAMAALGIAVLALGWRRPVNRWFAVFATSFGLAFVAANLLLLEFDGRVIVWFGVPAPGSLLFGVLMLIAVIAILGLVLTWPPGPRPIPPSALALAALPGLAILGAATYVYFLHPETSFVRLILPTISTTTFLVLVAQFAFLAAAAFALLVLALRLHLAPEGHPVVRQAAFLAIALLFYWAVVAGATVFSGSATRAPGPGDRLVQAVQLAAVAIVSITWLWAGGSGSNARPARAVAWTAPAIAILGLLWAGYLGLDLGLRGITRLATALLLAYGILRHQLLGIDVKVKWTIKQSTVAAVFISVFFIVSEGAAALFEAQTGSTVAGILAAGMLVFAIAPLQRLAERVADRAMPGVKAVGEMSEPERVHAFREACAQAWADGAVDRSERAMLDRMREVLRLSHEVAAGIESEAAAADGAGP